MNVILIGAGRYGNKLIGSKYARGDYYNAKLDCVIDPAINEIAKRDDFKLQNANLYSSTNEIPDEKINENTVAELAVNPTAIPRALSGIVKKGVKKIIFPKPVSQSYMQFNVMNKYLKTKNVQGYVASNWHYSDITKFLSGIISKIRGQEIDPETQSKFKKELSSIDDSFEIEKVEIEYSKKHEVLTIDPPSQEMPHALQIIQSSGLINLDDAKVQMFGSQQTESAVKASLYSEELKGGIHINSDLRKGDRTDKDRERLVKIYLNDDDDEADIIADYDACFANGFCKKTANISADITKNDKTIKWKKDIYEDNMDKMYESIYGAFEGKKTNALTLDEYAPIARKISEIQNLWSFSNKFKNDKINNRRA